jgi:hypothetical protein
MLMILADDGARIWSAGGHSREGMAMKFGTTATPQQVATMANVAEKLCKHAGFGIGTPEHAHIAEKVLALHEIGLRNERDLIAAVILPPVATQRGS